MARGTEIKPRAPKTGEGPNKAPVIAERPNAPPAKSKVPTPRHASTSDRSAQQGKQHCSLMNFPRTPAPEYVQLSEPDDVEQLDLCEKNTPDEQEEEEQEEELEEEQEEEQEGGKEIEEKERKEGKRIVESKDEEASVSIVETLAVLTRQVHSLQKSKQQCCRETIAELKNDVMEAVIETFEKAQRQYD